MKHFKILIGLFLTFLIIFIIGEFSSLSLFKRITNFLGYLLFPLAMLAILLKQRKTKDNLNINIILMAAYFLLSIAIHWDVFIGITKQPMEPMFQDLINLRSIPSLLFYLWSLGFMAYLAALIVLVVNTKKMVPENYLKDKWFILALSLAIAVFILDHGFFGPHYGFAGFHGHAFWESPGHLH